MKLSHNNKRSCSPHAKLAGLTAAALLAIGVFAGSAQACSYPGAQQVFKPAGSTAASPPVCMALDTPSFRFFARNTGDPSSRLRVEAVYKLLGLIQTKVVSNVSAGPTWAPSQSVSTVLGLSTIVGTLIPSAIQIRITPADSKGNWQVDDLYVDPFARH
jgi:hypothetical protein